MKVIATRGTALLFVIGFLLHSCNNAFMVLTPVLVLDLGGTLVEAGVQGSIYIAVAVGLRFLFGPLTDRYGVKLIMAVGAAAFAASGPMLALCSSFWQVLIVRCVQAVGLAAFFPAATSAVVAVAPTNRAGFVLGLYRLVSSTSLMVAPAVAFFVLNTSGFSVCLWMLGGCAMVAWCFVLAVRAPSNKKILRFKRCFFCSYRVFGPDVRIMVVVLGATFLAALGYGLLNTYAAPFVEALLPDVSAGLLFVLVGAGGIVSNPLIGWASDRMRHARLLIVLLVCMGLGVSFLSVTSMGFGVVLCSGFLIGFGYFGTVTCALAIVAMSIVHEQRVLALALQQNTIDVGIACASGVFGMVLETVENDAAVFLVWGVATIMCAIVGLVIELTCCRR